jgi:hypothetical protein
MTKTSESNIFQNNSPGNIGCIFAGLNASFLTCRGRCGKAQNQIVKPLQTYYNSNYSFLCIEKLLQNILPTAMNRAGAVHTAEMFQFDDRMMNFL